MHFLTPILLKSLAKRLPDTEARNISLSIQGIPPGYPHRPGGHYTENGQYFSTFWSGESEPHVDSFRCYTKVISSDAVNDYRYTRIAFPQLISPDIFCRIESSYIHNESRRSTYCAQWANLQAAYWAVHQQRICSILKRQQNHFNKPNVRPRPYHQKNHHSQSKE